MKKLLCYLFSVLLLLSCASALALPEDIIGMDISSFSAYDLYGNAVTGEVFSGYRLTLFNLWAPWCSHCVNELPALQQLYENYASKGVNVLGWLEGHNGSLPEDAIEMFESNGYNYSVLQPANEGILAELEDSYGRGVPVSFAVDSNGIILDCNIGSLTYDQFVYFVESNLQDESTWNGDVAESFDSGSGSESDPFVIKDASELALLAKYVNTDSGDYASKEYVLSADIYLNEVGNYAEWQTSPPRYSWVPIGYNASKLSGNSFRGVFDGRGYTIHGAYASSTGLSGDMGLFGLLCGTVKNLNLADAYFESNSNAGGIAATCENASITDSTVSGKITGAAFVGGIAGDATSSSFTRTSTSATVYSYDSCGGILGNMQSTRIEYSVNYSEATAKENAGGIVGIIDGLLDTSSVSYCWNNGNVTSISDDSSNGTSGGIVGNNLVGAITDCYNTGAVTIESGYAGGITGICGGESFQTNHAAVSTSYNVGSVSCQSGTASGITARDISFLSEHCYYLDTSAEGDSSSAAVALTAAEMQVLASFVGFDGAVWTIDGNPGYPYPELIAMLHDGYILLGDVTLDGTVNTGDAVMILRANAELILLTAEQEAVADITGDGRLNTGDAVQVLRLVAGLI